MLFTMAIGHVFGYVFNSFGLITIAFMFKPITSMLSVSLFLGYLVMWRSKRPLWWPGSGGIRDVTARRIATYLRPA